MKAIVQQTRGGQYTAYLGSGNLASGGINVSFTNVLGAKQAGLDVMLASGQGRLNTILIHTAAPGTAVNIYDAADVASGGPFITSGAKIIGTVPAWPQNGAISGAGPFPIPVDAPFASGLCVACKSGVNLFSLCYSLEPSPLAATPNG